MNLFDFDRKFYINLSDATGFHKDVIEKVHRLITILEFINGNSFLRERLVLKGGTALNLTIFNMPRLSVDIDMSTMPETMTILKLKSIILYGIIFYLSLAGK